MKKDQINHNTLANLVEANAISEFTIKAIDDTWILNVKMGEVDKTMMAKNSGKPRVWRKLDTLAKYLKGLGITRFNTDISEYDPSKKTLRRPDSANALKQAHQSYQNSKKENVESKKERKPNATDRAIQLAKEKWEYNRARLLEESLK